VWSYMVLTNRQRLRLNHRLLHKTQPIPDHGGLQKLALGIQIDRDAAKGNRLVREPNTLGIRRAFL
jgi:hypothetical protein